MGKLKELTTTSELVKNILEEYPETRNSDNALYIQVLNVYGKHKGINIEEMSVLRFFMHIKDMGVPSIESVGRCRRKIVETHPELAGNDVVEGHRALNEETYRQYARGYCL